MTPNQHWKQSFQTFAALPVEETTQQTSQIQTAVENGLSVGSDRPGVIANDLFKSLILLVVSLDDAVIDPWMQSTPSDSLLSGASRRLVDVLYNTVTEMDSISPRRPERTS